MGVVVRPRTRRRRRGLLPGDGRTGGGPDLENCLSTTLPFKDAGLGLAYGTVNLVEWNPHWPGASEALATSLRAALGDLAAGVEHVGSTAVAGVTAKPILDIAVGSAPPSEPTELISALAGLGYEFRGDKGNEGGLLFGLEDRPGHRVAHVHLVRHGDGRWCQYLAVRDQLRPDPTARAKYSDLKRRLAQRSPDDRSAYTKAKAAFIDQLLNAVE